MVENRGGGRQRVAGHEIHAGGQSTQSHGLITVQQHRVVFGGEGGIPVARDAGGGQAVFGETIAGLDGGPEPGGVQGSVRQKITGRHFVAGRDRNSEQIQQRAGGHQITQSLITGGLPGQFRQREFATTKARLRLRPGCASVGRR